VSADARITLEAALAGRYTIERELGRGGMATVYLARDLRHDRPVALKVLHPQLAASLGPERFLREIKLAARLQHPHILTVHDSGDAGGQLWFTMPYVEGESLRQRLDRERQLPVHDAVRLAREVALALDFAHRHGAIHRDVKPENILLVDGQALVADFGIARALAGDEDKLTETGMSIGTPAYMSPEQAAGDRSVDARTDVYSLGTVLYELLAGEPPFVGPSAQALIARRLTETPRPLRLLRETVPEGVARAVAKALARAPADRFTTAAEFARALEAGDPAVASPAATAPSAVTSSAPSSAQAGAGSGRRTLMVAGLAFLLGLGVLFAWREGHDRGAAAGPPGATAAKRLAVLPFENLGSAGDEYFADGITDEIRGKLATLPGLQVTASRSAAEYKNSSKDLATIARELGVEYLLVGKVRWEKGQGDRSRVRVSPELIQVATGSTRWQQPFDANLTDVFQVQADVAGRVAQALDVALGAGEKQAIAERPTRSLPAYDAYLRGEEASGGMFRGDPPSVRQALLYYEQAIALDSTFAAAWARRSLAYVTLYANSVPDPALGKVALESAQRARALAPDRPEAYLALAAYYRAVPNDGARAQEQAELGLKLAPRNVDLLISAALNLQALGQWEEATDLIGKAQAIDPRSVVTAWRHARALFWLRRYEESLSASERGLRLAPGDPSLIETRAMTFAARGDLAGARETIRRSLGQTDPAALVAYLANFYDMFWLLDEAQRQLLYRLTPSQFDDDRGAWGLSLAGTYALDGDHARARAYADTARVAFESRIRGNPSDPQLHVLLGVALAYLGRKAEAIREGQQGAAMLPPSRNAFQGPYFQHQLARIYILVGEPDRALDQLESLLRMPYYLTPAWLRIDPAFDSLRAHPRFQKLAEGTA
jgi:TolB-like protein/tetratricopeptide (TPR) repeat protein